MTQRGFGAGHYMELLINNGQLGIGSNGIDMMCKDPFVIDGDMNGPLMLISLSRRKKRLFRETTSGKTSVSEES
jgi:hypothetical protein